MSAQLTKLVNQNVKGYNIENKVDLYLILEDQVIAIKPNNGSFLIEKLDKYENDYTCFGKPNKLVSVHDLVDKIEPPKNPNSMGPYFTSSHYIVLQDRLFLFLSHVYTTGDPVSTINCQIDKINESYVYKPSEYRWCAGGAPNPPDRCN